MATVECILNKGLTIGETVHTKAVIREVTAGDLIDATDESEKLTLTPDGYQLIASPTLVGLNTLRRQIVTIGDYPGPLTIGELRLLSGKDMNLLQQKAAELDNATLEAVAAQGK